VPEASRAVAVALSVASAVGLAVDDALVLQDSNRLTLRLLPADVLELAPFGLDIRPTEDIGPFTKIVPALKAFPDAFIATADDDTKTLTVRRNGEVIKTMPISMGKNSTPTSNGAYIIGDRFSHLVMDSSTYGVPSNSPNGYRTEVDFATQMSYSGIYVHAAPWSVGSQGYSNVSHGCLNVSTSNAHWFYGNTKRGDIVEVVNTVGSILPGTDGLGDWNVPWEQWKAGNASL